MGTTDVRVFDAASEVLDYLLDGIDACAPGMIVGTYIAGSIALGDGRPDRSDIDVVLVRSGEAGDASTLAALGPVLTDLRRTGHRPKIDAIVLRESDMSAGPDRIAGARPVIFDSVANLDAGGGLRNPVTWHTLRQCGITWRGTPLDRDRLWHDPERLDTWTRGNLESYWRPWLTQSERLAAHPDLELLIDGATEWGVLGVTRLHYTLATGRITSKRGAGEYALATFGGRWHSIVGDALRIRAGRAGSSQISDAKQKLQEVRSYMTRVIDTALELPSYNRMMSSQG